MGEKLRIVIAEDHTILREGLCALLSSDSNFEIVGEAADGLEAVACSEKLIPFILLSPLFGIQFSKFIFSTKGESKLYANLIRAKITYC